jgi:hypothetical protein
MKETKKKKKEHSRGATEDCVVQVSSPTPAFISSGETLG